MYKAHSNQLISTDEAKTQFESTVTAQPVCISKYIASDPLYWKKLKRGGTRETPLTKVLHPNLFFSQEQLEKAKASKDYESGLMLSPAIRQRYFNKVCEQAIKAWSFQQIVLLGSGFDNRAFKKNQFFKTDKISSDIYSRVKFWEIDKAAILLEKERILNEHNIDKNATYIVADYTKDGFIELLIKTGVSLDRPTLFIWEGNIMYLRSDEVGNIISKISTMFKSYIIAFDFFKMTFIDSLHKLGIKDEWLTGVDDIEKFAKEHRLIVKDSKSIAELGILYEVFSEPPKDFDQYSVCMLSSSK